MVMVCLCELHVEVQVLLLYIVLLIARLNHIQEDAAVIIISNVFKKRSLKPLLTNS